MVVAIATCTSRAEYPGGALTKWNSGSYAPKNIKPMPMPALNIIAIQLTVRYSGLSPSLPSGMRPYLLRASQIAKMTKPVAVRMNSQPRLLVIQSRTVDETDARLWGLTRPQIRNATISAAVTPNTTGSSV